jgi:hypothetical protein
LTCAKQNRKRRICATFQAPTATGYPDDVDQGTLQQGPLAAGLKTELYGLRDYTAQFTDLDIHREHPPASRMILTDVDDSLGYGHLMHFKTPQPHAG